MKLRKTAREKAIARQSRVRKKIRATSSRPRLTVFRSNRYTSAQIIDDAKHETLVAAGAHELKGKSMTKTQAAEKVGELIAKKAKAKKITKVTFDRGAYRYHGRVKALAQSIREAGIEV